MNKSTNLIMALSLCVLFTRFTAAQPLADANNPQGAGVTMTLTHLSVNDQILNLSWKITNNSDHDVWICDSMDAYFGTVFDRFLDKDAKTLVIRRRFDVPMRQIYEWHYPPIRSRYVRLRSGEEKAESVSIALPVTYQRISAGESGNAEYAQHLALEIGFYDEDLPGLILEIAEIAERLNIDFSVGYHGFREDIRQRFFGGPIVALLFKSQLGFNGNVRSANAKGEMWMVHVAGAHMGEKVLRVEVDSVSIPYKSDYPPLVGQAGKGDPQSKEADGAKVAKADDKKPSEQKDSGSGK